LLIKKLIYFDTLILENENDAIKRQLYDLFFNWRQGVDAEEKDPEQPTNQVIKDELQERQERLKRIQLKKDQARQEFQDRGGFNRVLNDIFNPTDMKSLELDSVYQIKKFCRDFYQRKSQMSKELLETLDALSNERPSVLKNKSKHFSVDNQVSSKQESMDWMRLNAEKARVQRFKEIATSQTKSYYNILD